MSDRSAQAQFPESAVGGLTERLARDLQALRVLPRRLSLSTPGVAATVPMLRGLWGAVLHDTAPATAEAVFAGTRGAEGEGDRLPLYVLRPAAPDPTDFPALEWISLGAALGHETALLEAWLQATARGLGPERVPFAIRAVRHLLPDGTASVGPGSGWRLSDAVSHVAPGQPCRLELPAPLRLMRGGRLIDAPDLGEIALAGWRRVASLAGRPPPDRALSRRLLDEAALVPARPFRGGAAALRRWSANQGEVELRGVTGSQDFPAGLGAFTDLLAALSWVHVGKGTVFGLGQIVLHPI